MNRLRKAWTRAAATQLKPHHPYWIAGTGLLVGLLLFTSVVTVDWDTYKQIRGSLFTGFFTVAGFLLSAKTLVILNMKKEVYEKEHYLKKLHQDHWAGVENDTKRARAARGSCPPLPTVYRPLSQIGTLLSANIVLSLLTSFAQITLGLAEKRWTVVLCMATAISTACLLACSVFLMWQNFRALYKVWEGQAQDELEKQWQASMDAYHSSLPTPVEGELPVQPSKVVSDNPPQV